MGQKESRQNKALEEIKKPVILDRSLLITQIAMLSNLINIMNEDVANQLEGINHVLELFEHLPKGEYNITVKVV